MTTLTAANPIYGGRSAPMAPARPSASGGPGLTGADAWRIIRQRLVMIIILWVLSIGVTVGGTILWAKYYPTYRAEALVWVESIDPIDITRPLAREAHIQEDVVTRMLQDQAMLVTSATVLIKAIEDPKLRATQWWREAQEKAARKGDDEVELLRDILTSTPIRDTNYIQVTASWRNAEDVKEIVNAVVRRYESTIHELQRGSMKEQADSIDKELQAAQKRYEALLRQKDEFRRAQEFSARSGQEVDERVMTMTALETELGMETIQREAQYDALRGARAEDLPITEDIQALLDADAGLIQLEARVQELDQILASARERYGANHRTIKELEANRTAAVERLMSETNTKALRFKAQQLEMVRRMALEARDQLLSIRQAKKEAIDAQKDREAKLNDYERIEEKAKLEEAQVKQLTERKNQLELAANQRKTVRIEVRQEARTPKRMSAPKFELVIPAGCILGLAASIGLAFLLDMTDKSVRTPRDVLRQQIPVLGTIPTTEDDEIEIERPETAVLDAPHSIVAEAFKNLRANLFFSAPAGQQSTVLVTSPSGGNGKTTVASNLAIAIALTGRRVLLIDANFRRAGLPRIFSGMRADGLSNILIGQGHLDDYVTASSVPGLDLVSAGPIPPNPAELLGSSYLRDMLLEARARYDQIILDGPPVLLVSDAIVLSGAVDGVILVCQYRATSRGALQRSQSQLDAVNANIYGAVLNRVESRAGGYFRKNYREFYQYSESDEEGADRPKLDGVGGAAAAAAQVPGEDSATSLGMEAGESGVFVAAGTSDSELGLGEAAPASTGSDALDQEIASLGADLESGASLSGDSELGLSLDEPGEEDKPGDEPNPAR